MTKITTAVSANKGTDYLEAGAERTAKATIIAICVLLVTSPVSIGYFLGGPPLLCVFFSICGVLIAGTSYDRIFKSAHSQEPSALTEAPLKPLPQNEI
ncbi:MAG: hypothetical protein H7A39_00825 [Chlamydiales bacterium]|nr:hypothetical protein [Chlamydiales bacterium]